MSKVQITVTAEISFDVEAEFVSESTLKEYIVTKRNDVLLAASEAIGFREHSKRLYIDDDNEAEITGIGYAATTGLSIVLNENQLALGEN